MIRFENDSIDESEGMKDVIQEGKTLLRMRVSAAAAAAVAAAAARCCCRCCGRGSVLFIVAVNLLFLFF